MGFDFKDANFWIEQFKNGLTVGSIYALIALGYTMVYGILQMINFAHGEIYMIGSFAGWGILNAFGGEEMATALIVPAIIVAMIGGAIASAGASAVVERVAYRPLRRAHRLAPLISAIGVSIFLQYLVVWLTDARDRLYPNIFPKGTDAAFSIGVTDIQYIQLFLVGGSIIMMLGLYTFIQRSRTGKSIRAVAEDKDVATLMGIDVNRAIVITFMVGALMAGVAGVMWGLWNRSISGTMGFIPGIKAFTSAVLGGIGNVPGAMAGGYILGLSETIGREGLNVLPGVQLGNEWRDVVAFVVLIIVLLVRPTGIFGEVVGKRA